MSEFMSELSELSFDDIHFDGIQEELADLAAENVLYTGTYLGTMMELKLNVDHNDDDRQIASLRYQLCDDEGKQLKRVRVKVSWQNRVVNGRADKKFRLYAALRKALGTDSTDPREVLAEAKESALKVSVSEAYLVAGSDLHESHATRQTNDSGEAWVVLSKDDEEARMHYMGKGYEPITLTQGLYKAD